MAVDERALRALHQHLQEVLGVDDAGQVATLLNNVATKDDITELRRELRRDLERFATKEDLERFATKEDLERFATKEDLERFATKEDLERFATKEDLERFATTEDLERFATTEDLERFATKDDLGGFVTDERLADEFERFSLKMDARFAELLATVRGEFVSQLRAMWIGLVTVLVAIAGLGITLATTT